MSHDFETVQAQIQDHENWIWCLVKMAPHRSCFSDASSEGQSQLSAHNPLTTLDEDKKIIIDKNCKHWGWTDSSKVHSTCSSYKEPGSGIQNPNGGLYSSINPV